MSILQKSLFHPNQRLIFYTTKTLLMLVKALSLRHSSLILFFALCFTASNLFAQDKSGVVLKAGVNSTIFRNYNATLISNASAGYTIGFDGLFYDNKLLIQPGIHLMTFPRKYTHVRAAFKDVFTRPDSTYDYAFKLPVRLGADLIDLGFFRLKGSAGFYGLYSHDGIYLKPKDVTKKYHVSGGWTVNVGVILKFLTIDLDYDSTFGRPEEDGPLYMRSLSLTAGLFF